MKDREENDMYRKKLVEFIIDELKASIKYKTMCAYINKLGENFGSYYMVYMNLRDICSIANDELRHYRMFYEILISTTRINTVVDFKYSIKIDRMSKTEIFDKLVEVIRTSIDKEIEDYNEYINFVSMFKDRLGEYKKFLDIIIKDERRHRNILKNTLRFME